MKKIYLILTGVVLCPAFFFQGCGSGRNQPVEAGGSDTLFPGAISLADINVLASDSTGVLIRYGRELMLKTNHYIGPDGINGKYTGSRINCSNCHQDAGTKIFSFDLLTAYSRYPQYRAREGRILSLAERVNNCVMRPLNGKPIPENSREMKAFLAYYRWLDSQVPADKKELFGKSVDIRFINRAADPAKGAVVYASRCARCHGANGEGIKTTDGSAYMYPLLWGDSAYQSGSSMHRIIKMSRWLKANMPYDSARWYKPVLTDEAALDVAAYINDDKQYRPSPPNFDYPQPNQKPIDYGRGPFADTFSAMQHKFGPYQPIIDFWKAKGLKPSY